MTSVGRIILYDPRQYKNDSSNSEKFSFEIAAIFHSPDWRGNLKKPFFGLIELYLYCPRSNTIRELIKILIILYERYLEQY